MQKLFSKIKSAAYTKLSVDFNILNNIETERKESVELNLQDQNNQNDSANY